MSKYLKTLALGILLVFGLGFSSFAGTYSSPTLADSVQKTLIFKKAYGDNVKYLSVGERVKLRANGYGGLLRGKITNIQDDSLTIERNGNQIKIALNQISLIQKTTIGNIIASVFGVYSMESGVASMALGLILASEPILYAALAGTIFFVIGCILAFVGTLPFWVRAKRFNLAKGTWRMSVGKTFVDKYGKIRMK